MKNFLNYFLFITIASSIYLGFHIYIYWRISRGLHLTEPFRFYLRIFLLLAAWTFLFGEFLARFYHWYFLKYIGNIWFGVIVIAFTVFAGKDIAGILFPAQQKNLTLIAIVLTILMSSYALINGLRFPKIKSVTILTENWPHQLNNFSIIQLSDTHISNPVSKNWLRRLVNKINATNPDLIVITGDLTDIDLRTYPEYLKILSELKSRYGVYAVSGNHEFYLGIDKFVDIAQQSNFTLLRNTFTVIAEKIILAGIDDKIAPTFSEARPDVEKILSAKNKLPIILLAHSPEIFSSASQKNIVLQLSGHTHAGQIPPMTFLIRLYTPYVYGLYRKGNSYLYVTSGTGTWGPPMRLFTRSEIPKIVISTYR